MSSPPIPEPFEHNVDAILPSVEVDVLFSLVPWDLLKDVTKLWVTKFFGKLKDCHQCIAYETAAVHPVETPTEVYEHFLRKTAPSRSAVGIGAPWTLPGSSASGTTLALDSPNTIQRTLRVAGDNETTVDVTFAKPQLGNGTALHIKHDFVPRDLFPNIAEWWTPLFDTLKAVSVDGAIKYHGVSCTEETIIAVLGDEKKYVDLVTGALEMFSTAKILRIITRSNCRVLPEEEGPYIQLWTEFLKIRIRRVPYKVDTNDSLERLLYWRVEAWPKNFFVITNLYINTIPSAHFHVPTGVRLSLAHSHLLLKNKKQSLEFWDSFIKHVEKGSTPGEDDLETALVNAGY